MNSRKSSFDLDWDLYDFNINENDNNNDDDIENDTFDCDLNENNKNHNELSYVNNETKQETNNTKLTNTWNLTTTNEEVYLQNQVHYQSQNQNLNLDQTQQNTNNSIFLIFFNALPNNSYTINELVKIYNSVVQPIPPITAHGFGQLKLTKSFFKKTKKTIKKKNITFYEKIE